MNSVRVHAKNFCPKRDANHSEPLRTNANQRELPLDAPLDQVVACGSEEHAVRVCLNIAKRLHGRDQLTVAKLCGWKSDSCLSEIVSPHNKRKMPPTRRKRFALATGCNLLNQYLIRKDAEAKLGARPSERSLADMAASACIHSWSKAA